MIWIQGWWFSPLIFLQPYLYKVWCTIYMHHKSLIYLMDQLNLNMKQRKWLDVVKDQDCKILYHLGKANLAVDDLSRRANITRIRGLCLRMVNTSPLLELIKQEQIEGIKEENQKKEKNMGHIFTFVTNGRSFVDAVWKGLISYFW